MNTKSSQITVNGLDVEVLRKDIKNLHLGVYPPTGRVRIATPRLVTDAAVRRAIAGKLGWIKRQQKKFRDQPRQSKREMITGESHYFLGQRYRLRVICAAERKIVLKNSHLEMFVPEDGSAEDRANYLLAWYREQLKAMIPALVVKWQNQIGVQIAFWGVKRMKTRWGSCNPKSRRIWLNLELVKKPPHCLEYILVHELVHLLERHHNARFADLMDKYYPRWKLAKAELNQFPLGHSDWRY